ncbi:ATPase [Lentibacter algarum]|uniref:ATPase n=1 Tax=Lentibacter algarum TaxID=576131 RepID=UPI001C0668D4|nr:ATPase [Lentibacter algarum]MBU2982279.1 ATPase [Lentibacter algarum]
MLYNSAQEWQNAVHKRVLFFGMSGLGKTHVSNTLRDEGDWFHYSVDYRIGTRYMSEPIVDACMQAAMREPFLAQMLKRDAISLSANVHTHDLSAVSTYLGKPGSAAKGGLSLQEYKRRQAQFKAAEISALQDTTHFIARGQKIYSYPHFICDTGGSICEWVDAENPDDKILKALSENTLMIWLKGSDAHINELIARFDRAPKPMAYQPEFLASTWSKYLSKNKCSEDEVDPDDFIRYAYGRALTHRQPRYEAMSQWGVTVSAEDISTVRDSSDFNAVVSAALTAK